MAVADGGDDGLARRVDHADQADHAQAGDGRLGERGSLGQQAAGQEQHTHALFGISLRGVFDGTCIERHAAPVAGQLIDRIAGAAVPGRP